MFKFRKRILCVGGGGFIGSHLPLEKTLLEKWDFLDLKDGEDFIPLASKLKRYDVIVFLAVDMEQSIKAYQYNLSLYRALDEYMERWPDTHIIYTSSAAVYHDSMQSHNELDIPIPPTWYGQGKLSGEIYVAQHQHHTILRLANVYGDGDGDGIVDRFKRGESTIYGNGSNIRDYIPVDLVALAINSAMDFKWYGIINVSSGKGRSVNDLWALLGKGREPEYTLKRFDDVNCSVLDNRKLMGLLGEKE